MRETWAERTRFHDFNVSANPRGRGLWKTSTDEKWKIIRILEKAHEEVSNDEASVKMENLMTKEN